MDDRKILVDNTIKVKPYTGTKENTKHYSQTFNHNVYTRFCKLKETKKQFTIWQEIHL